MPAYDEFESKVQKLIDKGCSVDNAISQVKREWSDGEAAAQLARLAREKLKKTHYKLTG